MLRKEYSNHSTEYIVNAICNGNQMALGLLYDKYATGILGLLHKNIGDLTQAENALQLCFITIWQKRGSYNPSKETACSWLLNIAWQCSKVVKQKIDGYTENQVQGNYVNNCVQSDEEWNRSKLLMEFIIFKSISEAEAANRMDIALPELRKMMRIEMNKLRTIQVV